MAYKEQKFITVLEAVKSKIKAPANLASDESWLPGSQTAFSVCSHGKGIRELSAVSFMWH